jgi:hypothetical protein
MVVRLSAGGVNLGDTVIGRDSWDSDNKASD